MRNFALRNLKDVLREVFFNPGIKRFEISQNLSMAAATVSKYADRLISQGIIEEIDNDRRRHVSLQLKKTWRSVLGIDIGAWQTRLIKVESGSSYSVIKEFPTPTDARKIWPILRQYEKEVHAIAVAITAVIDPQGKRVVIFANQRGWDGFDFTGQKLRVPLLLMSSGGAAARAEKAFGAMKPFQSGLHVNVGHSIQAGVYLENHLVEGSNHAAGELGHVFSSNQAGLCSCGNIGCLENIATVPIIMRHFKQRMQSQVLRGTLARLCENDPQKIVPALVAQAWTENDPQVRAEMDHLADAMATALSGFVNVLNPQAITLGGRMFSYFPQLSSHIHHALRGKVLEPNSRNLAVLGAAFPEYGAAFGAAIRAFETFIDSVA